jgi:hypothetical protein
MIVLATAAVLALSGVGAPGADGSPATSPQRRQFDSRLGLEPPVAIGPGQGVICARPPCPLKVTVTTAADLQRALEQASAGTVVQVPADVSINLDPLRSALPLRIKEGVTLYGGRGSGPSSRGALISLSSFDQWSGNEPASQRAAFRIDGDHAVIQGIRLRGPYGGADKKMQGGPPALRLNPSLGANPIEVSPTAIVIPGVAGIVDLTSSATITGNEIYNWPNAAVHVSGGIGEPGADCARIPVRRFPGSVIADNYIHHNQRDSLGYGVGVKNGALPLIKGNTFAWNRHSINGDGHPQSGYYALYNYVLSPGHKYGPEFTYEGSYGQHFDMHGDDNTGDDEDTDDGYGGHGGDLVEILGNTVHGEQRYGTVLGFGGKTRAVYMLRGRPCRTHVLRGNVLVHDKDNVVRTKGGGWAAPLPHVTRDYHLADDNRYNTDTSHSLAVGDFDGDARDDLFQATGAAWYYSSGGVREWRLLQDARRATLDRLRFRDFDGDHLTDVFTTYHGEWRLSRGGRRRWETLAVSPEDVTDLRFGDFDGDGRTDVLKADGSTLSYRRGGSGAWQPLSAAERPIDDLRTGNFDGGSIADVFAIEDDRWAVKYDGRGPWRRLNSRLATRLDSLVFEDFDGNGLTDIAQSRTTIDPHLFGGRSQREIEWRVSWGGTTPWRPLREVPDTGAGRGGKPYSQLFNHWIGRFDANPGADALRYEPLPTLGLVRGAELEGRALVVSSGARTDYVKHSRDEMR